MGVAVDTWENKIKLHFDSINSVARVFANNSTPWDNSMENKQRKKIVGVEKYAMANSTKTTTPGVKELRKLLKLFWIFVNNKE